MFTEDAIDSPLDWDDRYLVGHQAIDRTHAEFVELLSAMQRGPDHELPRLLDALAAHIETHFALEERLMREHEFPARECHADEHARVMASVQEVRVDVAAGERHVARELARALADWFPGHSDYMDSALAIWVVKRRTAGAPVVLRRFKRDTTGAVL
jgi:hemerythrin